MIIDLFFKFHCSGLPGRTSLRRYDEQYCGCGNHGLFRSSRPDFIETSSFTEVIPMNVIIVPVFQAGLH